MNNNLNSVVSVCIFSAVQRKIGMMRLKHFIHNRRYVQYMWTPLCATRLRLKLYPLKERTKYYRIPMLLKPGSMLVFVNNTSNKKYGLCFKVLHFMKPGNFNASAVKYPSVLQKKEKRNYIKQSSSNNFLVFICILSL
jgi:hypothetical protein